MPYLPRGTRVARHSAFASHRSRGLRSFMGEEVPTRFVLPGESTQTANVRLARDRVTTTETTTGREANIAPGDISAADKCLQAGGRWNPIRYNCDMTVVTQPKILEEPIKQTDPYAQQRANCAMRSGFAWDDIRKQCVSSDPYVEQKNRCALMNGRWDPTRNLCQYGTTIREPTGPSIPVPPPIPEVEPEVSVLDQTKDTNGAPASMIDTDRSSGGGSGIPQWVDAAQQQTPITISVGGGGTSAPASSQAPKWIIPAIIAASMFL